MRTPSRIEAVDDIPLTAPGRFAAVRRGYDEAPWEMWLYAMDLNLCEGWDTQLARMDLTYPEYLQNLALTKGIAGWQFLFVEGISLDDPELDDVAASLRAMLEVFPQLFPDHDYSALRRRLEQRGA
jgi:hypothetical protein